MAVGRPQFRDRYLVSAEADNEFARPIQVRKGSGIPVSRLDELLGRLAENGTLAALYAKYGLPPPRLPRP